MTLNKTREFTHLLDNNGFGIGVPGDWEVSAFNYKESQVSIKGNILDHMQEYFQEYSHSEDEE